MSLLESVNCIECGMNIDPEVALMNTGHSDRCDDCALKRLPMNNPIRLVDGDKLQEWTKNHIAGKAQLIMTLSGAERSYAEGVRDAFITMEEKLESLQPSPSDLGVAARVTLLENYLEELREITPYGMYQEQITNVLKESRSLSSPTAETNKVRRTIR